jgi:hypothetical protein
MVTAEESGKRVSLRWQSLTEQEKQQFSEKCRHSRIRVWNATSQEEREKFAEKCRQIQRGRSNTQRGRHNKNHIGYGIGKTPPDEFDLNSIPGPVL